MKKMEKIYFILTYMFFLYPPFIFGLVEIYRESDAMKEHIVSLIVNLILIAVIAIVCGSLIKAKKLHVPNTLEIKHLIFGLTGNIVMYFYTFQNIMNIEDIITIYLILLIVLVVDYLLISKKIIDEIGLLDEQFPMFFSDVDICKRIWDAGYNVQYNTKSLITHEGGVSVYRKRIKMIVSSHLSFCKYFNKYNTKLFDYILNILVGIFLLVLIPFRILLNLLFPNLIKRERRSL